MNYTIIKLLLFVGLGGLLFVSCSDDIINDTNNSNNNNNDGKDNTTAPGKLPQTGVSIGVSLAIIVVIASGTFAYIRYRKLKGI